MSKLNEILSTNERRKAEVIAGAEAIRATQAAFKVAGQPLTKWVAAPDAAHAEYLDGVTSAREKAFPAPEGVNAVVWRGMLDISSERLTADTLRSGAQAISREWERLEGIGVNPENLLTDAGFEAEIENCYVRATPEQQRRLDLLTKAAAALNEAGGVVAQTDVHIGFHPLVWDASGSLPGGAGKWKIDLRRL